MKSILIIILFSFFLLVACGEKQNIKEIELLNNNNSNNSVDKQDSIPVIYVAVSTMISPLETFNLYKDVMDYISKKLNVNIEFKQRKTYREVNELLAENKLDFAFICTGAYLEAMDKIPIEILVVPVVNGKPYYQAYILVNEDSNINSFDELRDKSFAFTDPLSNTGYSYVVNILKERRTTPEKFFSKTIFTYAHDYSIQAVKRKLVDGATVDGLVYEYLKHFQPEKIEGVKIIHKSKDFGIPPFVVQKILDKNLKEKLRKVMLEMHLDTEGKKLLNKIMIDKFILADDSLYRWE
ncbi:ABC-type phosphonate transport system periplasmic component [Ignavibacterium album JCM 16511]|uniref:ABC-type phosphonate transport system periplasmic component n=1 Tax=Ignavibacterium album (strain DSM 19864 / JCM 16511 / NBRC 101810 / Mat9-16) TaxID=945713 RepID=I0ANG8_IGNAJ|nr:phosphate/phosphite/phosphonate ABC transporter substrate-binding protein [Ignavibacterium album]AFH50525.1 ABC-type phosphonate transport system periplasmic component [Ignavibacterium album JCM 16511]